MSRRGVVRLANVGLVVFVSAGCGVNGTAQRDALWAEYPRLADDAYNTVGTCSFVPAGTTEQVLVLAAITSSGDRLPDDMTITDIEATSDAGWPIETVGVVGEPGAIPMEDQFNENQLSGYELRELPLRRSPDMDFALGVVVDVPVAARDDEASMNPPSAVRITGAFYESGGESYFWRVPRESFVSRFALDHPDFCARHSGELARSSDEP